MSAPPLSALRAFEAVARLGSVSRAGDELNVTHAAISHQLKNLEEWYGGRLVLRSGRGIRLTSTGEELSRQLTPAFRQIAAASARVAQMTRGGYLTIGCIPSIASRWLVPMLPAFAGRYPDAEIRVVYAQVDEELRDSTLDVLITYSEREEAGTRAAKLFSRINKPVCSRGFLEERGPVSGAAWFSSAPLLHDADRDGWREWFVKAGVAPEAAESGPVYQDFNLLATAAVAGHGVALCPVEVFRQEIASGDLIVLSDVATKQDRAYFVKLREDARPLAESFAAWFVECVGAPVDGRGRSRVG